MRGIHDIKKRNSRKLKAYTDFFGEHFHGLTGDLDTLRQVAKSVSAVFVHRQVNGELLWTTAGILPCSIRTETFRR